MTRHLSLIIPTVLLCAFARLAFCAEAQLVESDRVIADAHYLSLLYKHLDGGSMKIENDELKAALTHPQLEVVVIAAREGEDGPRYFVFINKTGSTKFETIPISSTGYTTLLQFAKNPQ